MRAPLALTVFIDLSASDGEEDEIRVGEGGAPCAQMKNFHLGQCPPAHQGCVSHPRTLKATITLNVNFSFFHFFQNLGARGTDALTVSIDLSASDGERDEIRIGKGRGEGQKATTSGAVWTQVRRLFRLR